MWYVCPRPSRQLRGKARLNCVSVCAHVAARTASRFAVSITGTGRKGFRPLVVGPLVRCPAFEICL